MVLLLEPDPDVRELLASALERDRLVVHTAADGRSGLRLFYARRVPPCASPFTLQELGAGMHTFAVRADDRVGTDQSPATRTFRVLQ